MDDPRPASRRWQAILLPAIFSVLLLVAVAVWQHRWPAELPSPRSAPPPAATSAEVGLPDAGRDCLFPGSGADYYGECPDSEGYYSSRRHFAVDSPNRLRRSLVLLEMDEDRSLHLRLSKADLDEMPTVDEVLPLVEVSPEESAEILARIRRGSEVLQPRFEDSRSGGKQASDGVWVLTPPVSGFELRSKGGDNYEPPELWSVDLESRKVLWSEALDFNYDIEFSASRPSTFFLFSETEGLMLFDLRAGRLCSTQEPSSRVGRILRRPFYLGNGTDLQYVEGEAIWRLDLSTCQRRAVGTLVLPPHELAAAAELESVATTSDGTVVLATIQEGFAGVVELARDPSPNRRQHVWLEYDGERYVERRRVTVRSHNAISGFDGLSWELARDPLLVAGYFQDFQLDMATGKPNRQSRSGDLSHVLIRNQQGNFYALRTSARGTLFQVDSRRGLLNYAGKWWDLKVLDRPLESDLD